MRESLVGRASEDDRKETAMVSYNILDATLTGCINDTSALL